MSHSIASSWLGVLFVVIGCTTSSTSPSSIDTGAPVTDSDAALTSGIDADLDGFDDTVDCDDTNASVYPGADEVCDDLDNDCDTIVDEDPVDGVTYFEDLDRDTFGNPDVSLASCDVVVGFVLNSSDCDDRNAAVLPGAVEVCDGIDNDCDPKTMPTSSEAYFIDAAGTRADYTSQLLPGEAHDLKTPGTLALCGGTYTNSFLVHADVQILGEPGLRPVLKGGASDHALVEVLADKLTVEIAGVELTEGRGSLRSCGPYGCWTEGGAVYSDAASDLVVRDVVLRANQASRGTAISVLHGGLTLTSSDVIENIGFDDYGTQGFAMGGALALRDAQATVHSTLFANNTGSALFVLGSTTVVLTDSTLEGNSGFPAGGLSLSSDSTVELVDTLVTGNVGYSAGGADVGGGSLSCRGTKGEVAGFHDNTGSLAGAVHLERYSTGDSTFTADVCDLGSNTEDNAPSDVSSMPSTEYGDDVSMTCSSEGCK
ncbi:MAG: hypothetical protein KTR31_31610 [Myxococcales bacterium]|nr:hypothetical protein [Myxococcales bacterium]